MIKLTNKIKLCATLLGATGILCTNIFANTLTVKMVELSSGKVVGNVLIEDTKYGALFTPILSGLKVGAHGFHVHTNPSCGNVVQNGKTIVGGASGGHYDPKNTNKHGAPWTDNNHLGDLPALVADSSGNATLPVLAPRLTTKDLQGRSLMLHFGGDNYSDSPAPLGGGGARMVCGVIE